MGWARDIVKKTIPSNSYIKIIKLNKVSNNLSYFVDYPDQIDTFLA